MANRIHNLKLVKNTLCWARRIRFSYLLSTVNTWGGMSVLDVGCGCDGRSFEQYAPPDFEITGVDLFAPVKVTINHPRFKYLKQNARDLSVFQAKEFDLALSIGMMEHICDRGVLNKMALEIRRVAKQWIIVVPWKYCLIEPHFKFPLFQFFSKNVQKWLTKQFNLHNLGAHVQKNPTYISSHYQWLSASEYMYIFKADTAFVFPPFFLNLVIAKRSS